EDSFSAFALSAFDQEDTGLARTRRVRGGGTLDRSGGSFSADGSTENPTRTRVPRPLLRRGVTYSTGARATVGGDYVVHLTESRTSAMGSSSRGRMACVSRALSRRVGRPVTMTLDGVEDIAAMRD